MNIPPETFTVLQAAPFRRFVEMVRSNSHDFEAQGRVLRLKQYISADVRPAAINAILEALAVNTLVEVLYIQNFEHVSTQHNRMRLLVRHSCTVISRYNNCVGCTQNCPYIQLSLLRSTTVVRMQCLIVSCVGLTLRLSLY